MNLPFPHSLFRSLAILICVAATGSAADLYVGAATVDITPDQPVALAGQMHVRIAREQATRIQASALTLESREGDRSLEHVVSVSVDLVAPRDDVLQELRTRLAGKADGLDPRKVFLSATHTHTAPVTTEGDIYDIPQDGVMQPEAYIDFLVDRLVAVITESWNGRRPGKFGYAQGQAVVAQNRRATYAYGSARMYGETNTEEFRTIEGQENHNLDVLFFWDPDGRLIATAVNLPCPSQEVEGLSTLHADFWDPVRRQLREKHGSDLHVIAWTGAAGDVVSRPMFDRKADERMRRLRGLTRLEEMARRIVRGWEDAYAIALLEPVSDPVLNHRVKMLDLPLRAVTKTELAEARAEMEKYRDDPAEVWKYNWNKRVVDRHAAMAGGTAEPCRVEVHILRLGDVAIATNPFELFTAYGARMKARSPAVQSFVIQLTGSAGYLPTDLAVQGGGYSAIVQSSRVGPEGGQALVNETVAEWMQLWNP